MYKAKLYTVHFHRFVCNAVLFPLGPGASVHHRELAGVVRVPLQHRLHPTQAHLSHRSDIPHSYWGGSVLVQKLNPHPAPNIS
jgi:hypothetical protein